ncbi:MAG TPA: nuclear transport factor 2 family protein [Streptosporangiaceae bacterium]|jgi:ketosteroid isomerase-like protein
MAEHSEATEILREMWARIDARDWDGLGGLLDPGLVVQYTQTGETFDSAGFVRVNREYPGRWYVTVEDVVGDGERAVCRARVTDGQQTYHVASFAIVRGGRITDMVEVWSESGQEPPPGRRS